MCSSNYSPIYITIPLVLFQSLSNHFFSIFLQIIVILLNLFRRSSRQGMLIFEGFRLLLLIEKILFLETIIIKTSLQINIKISNANSSPKQHILQQIFTIYQCFGRHSIIFQILFFNPINLQYSYLFYCIYFYERFYLFLFCSYDYIKAFNSSEFYWYSQISYLMPFLLQGRYQSLLNLYLQSIHPFRQLLKYFLKIITIYFIYSVITSYCLLLTLLFIQLQNLIVCLLFVL
ncbi:transmembrane protein, putative (macronuclear) [Tetrahymena thermophila SB210]|uniref:Transmembrane protein, putative n=1 Tax=Tetrahymena thermophila (strain SB210) TaxID=312017 RepID=W7XHB1_TETTS|nr:transmembrane protein, putative [Tetrahymena thermophila SB210]EWS72434.1 transmembrane protein, putative [Tetrahymena thermophila SB210]|eukprot:XP_012655031.1 transmembrane protein, putative [Tetrahymena thermophila SB210]